MKKIKTPSLWIGSETDRLRKTVVSSGPGVEAVLGQLYPLNVSLFFDKMDVIKADKQMKDLILSLKNHYGVEVIIFEEVLAKMLPTQNLSKETTISLILEKAKKTREQFKYNLENWSKRQLEETIAWLIDRDIGRYGESQALTLTYELCLRHDLPLANYIFARDQMNVIQDLRVVANMAYNIRKPEVALYDMVYKKVIGPHNTIKISAGETFEGGDAIIHNNTVYIGLGSRTSFGAALHIFSALGKKYKHLNFVIVEDPNTTSLSFQQQQDTMHLDTILMPTGEKQMVVCEEEANRRKVKTVKIDSEGNPTVGSDNIPFIDYLKGAGYEIINIPKNEQSSFGANFLVIDDRHILMPLDRNFETNTKLEAAGKKLDFVDLGEITNGYGAAHCALGQLLRLG